MIVVSPKDCPTALDAAGVDQPVLIVSGMHRSGTSLLAAVCQSAGLHLGERMMRSTDSNPLGHFEDLDFYEFHQRVLAANGACKEGFLGGVEPLEVPPHLQAAAAGLIDARKRLARPWGWKDPRTTLFLDFWQSLLPAARWLFVVRPPWQVVDSLFRRRDQAFLDNPPFALRVWRHYNELVRAFAVRHPATTMVVDVGLIASDPQALIASIRDRLGIPLSAPADVFRRDLLATGSSAHHVAIVRAADPRACELYEELREMSAFAAPTAGERGDPALGVADAALMEWAASAARTKVADASRHALEQQRTEVQALVAERDGRLFELENRLESIRSLIAERNAQAEAFAAGMAEREATIAGLAREVEVHRNSVHSLQQAATAEQARILSLSRDLHDSLRKIAALEQDIGMREERLSLVESEHRRHLALYHQMLNSNSWRLTEPLREARRWVTHPGERFAHALTRFIKGCRSVYDRLPISCATRLRHRRLLASRFPRVLLASGSPAATIPGLVRSMPPQIGVRAAAAPLPARAASSRDRITLPRRDEPAVSVILPVRDQWAHTLACLRSIVAGEPTLAYEVILADDASTDDTRDADQWVDGLVVHRNAHNLGFLRNCNAAARRARGEYLLFLNNDTEIQPGAITSLLQTFRDRPDAGLVGSKLIYPDGRLQEAGGIVWNDGSAWNYGRGQNPALPEFNYVRETDYCSGASIMVPRALFTQLGGFDERYAPAYYEDTDLAFAVRAAGRKVYYQPSSVVVHHEGASHGVDTGQGVKSGQRRNQRLFEGKWRETLTRDHFPNGLEVFKARDRSRHVKTMLVIDHYLPQPDRDAGSRVMWSFLRLFRSMGFNVKFWPQNLRYDPAYAAPLEQLGVEIFHGPHYVDGFDAWARVHGAALDYVLLSRPQVAIDFLTPLRKHSRAKLLFYGHDLHHARMMREHAVTQEADQLKKADAMRDLEISIWRRVDAVYYPSFEETAVVLRECPGVAARTVPLYFFDERTSPNPGPAGRRGILFVAGFAHPPNVDAAAWLVRDVMPLVHREMGDAHLYLVGSHPTAEVCGLASDHVTVTGYVSDQRLAEFYRSARVAVVPLRFGAGVKSKVIEAMHHGIPLVTTPTGAQGLESLESAVPVAADAADIAAEILSLLRDDVRWGHVAAAGEAYVTSRFTIDAMRRSVAADICAAGPSTAIPPHAGHNNLPP